jgi:hypothetical protein
MTMAPPKTMVAAHLLIFINGRRFGEATSIRWSIPTPHNARQGLDSLQPYGYDPAGTKVSISLSMVRVHGTGALEGRGITAPASHMARQKYDSILVVDRVTGKRVFQCDHCVVTNQDWTAAAKQRVEGTFTFDAIEGVNEAEYL